jgi:hypothetical protein
VIRLRLLLPAAGAAVLSLSSCALLAQDTPKLACNDRSSGSQARFCEVREQPGASSGRIAVDASPNGGISIRAWSRADVLIRSKVDAAAPTEAEARQLASQVVVRYDGAAVVASGPESRDKSWWSVSYEVFVPKAMDLKLVTVNGGVSINGVKGNIEFRSTNGGVHLEGLAGHVQGSTTNGGVNVSLSGERWDGDSLDVRTTNGGVNLQVPTSYSARLEMGTVNGGMKSDVPAVITPRGSDEKTIQATLGAGGPLIRVQTTNGGVSVKRGS